MRKLLLLCVLASGGCGFTKTHVIIYEVHAAHVHAPVPISSVSMKTTLIPLSKYEGQRQDLGQIRQEYPQATCTGRQGDVSQGCCEQP